MSRTEHVRILSPATIKPSDDKHFLRGRRSYAVCVVSTLVDQPHVVYEILCRYPRSYITDETVS